MVEIMNDNFNEYFQQYIYKLNRRFNSLSMGLNWYLDHQGKTIVETGTSRIIGNFAGDGCASILFAEIAKLTNTHFWTCDILPAHIDACKFMTVQFKDSCTYIVGDSVKFLEEFNQPISLLYLDSMDFVTTGDPNPAQDHAVKEYLAAKEKLTNESIVIIDDCGGMPFGGKGGKVVPLMESDGWVRIYSDYQIVLIKNEN